MRTKKKLCEFNYPPEFIFLIILTFGIFNVPYLFSQQKELTAVDSDILHKFYYERYEEIKTVYQNPLSNSKDVKDFILEGKALVSFPNNRMRMQNLLDPIEKQKSNFVFWCPQNFPDNISISWNFYPIEEPGLCILFFSAKGINGKDIFDTSLMKREGDYKQYHHGDINAYHISYFRRNENERNMQLCNLRKSYGFYMTAQGADPIPPVKYAAPPYKMRVVKFEDQIEFYINDLLVLEWKDDGKTYGPVLNEGKLGFRQMAPLVAEYSNLKVTQISKKNN